MVTHHCPEPPSLWVSILFSVYVSGIYFIVAESRLAWRHTGLTVNTPFSSSLWASLRGWHNRHSHTWMSDTHTPQWVTLTRLSEWHSHASMSDTHTPESAILFNFSDSLSHPPLLRLPLHVSFRGFSLPMAFCLHSLSWRDLVHPQSCTHFVGIQYLTTYLQEKMSGSKGKNSCTVYLCQIILSRLLNRTTGSHCYHFCVWQTLLSVKAPWHEDCEDVWHSAGIWHLFMKWKRQLENPSCLLSVADFLEKVSQVKQPWLQSFLCPRASHENWSRRNHYQAGETAAFGLTSSQCHVPLK